MPQRMKRRRQPGQGRTCGLRDRIRSENAMGSSNARGSSGCGIVLYRTHPCCAESSTVCRHYIDILCCFLVESPYGKRPTSYRTTESSDRGRRIRLPRAPSIPPGLRLPSGQDNHHASPGRHRPCQKGYLRVWSVSYTHLRAHETDSYLVCRLLLEKK